MLDAADVDGDALTYLVLTAPSHGTLSGTGANLTYSPDLNYHGTDSFTYRVNDGQLDSNAATVSLTVTAVNDAPIAQDDTASTTDQTAITIPVLNNDNDPDLPNDTLSVISVSVPAGTPGTVTFTATGVTYTPSPNTHGDVSFQYTIQDSTGVTSTATVMVHVTDVTAPQLLDVLVRFGSQTYSIKNVARDLPWITIDELDLVFSEGVDLSAADLKLTGSGGKDYMVGAMLDHAAGASTASLKLPTAIGVDRLMLLLDGDDTTSDGVLGIQDTSGNYLSGGDYRKDFAVLPGDYDGDSVVTIYDAVAVRNTEAAFGGIYTLFADTDGNGINDNTDILNVLRRVGFRLP